MSLRPEQIDAFTIAIEQELTDDNFMGSDYTEQVTALFSGLDPDTVQDVLVKVAADLGLLFSGAVTVTREERERVQRERVEREEEERLLRRENRRRARAQREQESTCSCGDPGCQFAFLGGGRVAYNYASWNTAPTNRYLPAWERALDGSTPGSWLPL